MKISAVMGMWMCGVFGLVCFGFAFNGFYALLSITDAEQRDLTLGYASFWAFLGCVAVVFGVLSWMIKEGKLGDPEQM
jgi:phosphotransferase system  glucose/maltose/N-acetylglucosamine-specific IIC component